MAGAQAFETPFLIFYELYFDFMTLILKGLTVWKEVVSFFYNRRKVSEFWGVLGAQIH